MVSACGAVLKARSGNLGCIVLLQIEDEDVYDIEREFDSLGGSGSLSETPKSVKITFEGYGDVLAVAKSFKTGSRGYYGSGKIEIAGKRY